MTNNFNVVTALQTIHEHVHAVGCGCIPSDWTTGDPGAFCETNNVFVPGLGAWFVEVSRCPSESLSAVSPHLSLPSCAWWSVRRGVAPFDKALPISFAFEGLVNVDERGVATAYHVVPERLKAYGVPTLGTAATLIDYARDRDRAGQACGRAEIRGMQLPGGGWLSVWTTPDTFIVSDGYNLSWRYPAAYVPEPAVSEPESSSIWDLL